MKTSQIIFLVITLFSLYGLSNRKNWRNFVVFIFLTITFYVSAHAYSLHRYYVAALNFILTIIWLIEILDPVRHVKLKRFENKKGLVKNIDTRDLKNGEPVYLSGSGEIKGIHSDLKEEKID